MYEDVKEEVKTINEDISQALVDEFLDDNVIESFGE